VEKHGRKRQTGKYLGMGDSGEKAKREHTGVITDKKEEVRDV